MKTKVWVELIPGVGFKGVNLGKRMLGMWWVIYRDYSGKCHKELIKEKYLIERYTNAERNTKISD